MFLCCGNRRRFIDVPTPTGSRRLIIRREWVIPTGGGYFFSPPIEAIAGVLGTDRPPKDSPTSALAAVFLSHLSPASNFPESPV